MEQNKRRRKYVGTPLQKKLLLLIFISAAIPTGIVAVCLYYLILSILAWQAGMPQVVALNLIPVLRKINLIVLLILPLILLFIWIIALELSHRIAGPLYRLEKELDARIRGEKSGPIQLRKKDELKTVVDKLNELLNKK